MDKDEQSTYDNRYFSIARRHTMDRIDREIRCEIMASVVVIL